MSIDSNDFKNAMSQWASGVTIVTTNDGDTPIGMTASSFTSLSMEPPLILVCINKKLHAHKIIQQNGKFAVNLLSVDQVEWGKRFATSAIKNRFADIQTTTATTGCPILPNCLAWVDCEVWNIYEGGSHSIFVGKIVDLKVNSINAPLLYYNRKWRKCGDL